MRKLFLFLSFLTVTLFAAAQNFQIDQQKKELDSHKQQDTIRVNLLNELAFDLGSEPGERKKYADEALAISRKIKYVNGQGFAFSLLAYAAFSMKNQSESKSMFHLADSIANITGSPELKADILYRKSNLETNSTQKDILLQEAYLLAKKTDRFKLQSNILINMALSTEDVLKKKRLLIQADSLAQKAGDIINHGRLSVGIAFITKDLKERNAYINKAVSITEKTGDLKSLVDLLITIGNRMAATGDKDALTYFLKAEEAAQKSGDKVKLSKTQGYIGSYYMNTFSDYARAMEYYLKELNSAEIANDTLSLITCWIDLGGLYTYLGDQDNALSYLLKAENANKILGDKSIEYSLQNSLGENYRLSGKYPEAINAYHKAIELYKNFYGTKIDYVDESNLADVYTRTGSLDSAFYFGFRTLKTLTETGDIVVAGFTNGVLSRAYLKKNMTDSAIYYGRNGLTAAKESGTIEFMRDNTLALAHAYAAKKDFANAYANQLLYMTYRDSMMNEEVRNRTAVQQYTFNLDKKEAQIGVLNEQKKGQRNMLIGAMALLALILAVAGLLMRNNHQKQKANALLEKQKQEINEKAQNVELLSDVGRKITSSLSIEKIIGTVYKNVNTLMDANVFGIGIYNETLKRIEFPSTYENGEPLPFYANAIDDKNRFGAVCFKEGKEIIINNLDEQYKDHIQEVATPDQGGQPESIIFLPLISKAGKLGVLTVQSFQKNAYSDYQLFMLRNIATYTTIAIENAESYDALNSTLSTLKSAQTQLIQSEKMASLGELTAGIAHEIQNPLNFVNNFSEVSKELLDEMKAELNNGNTEDAKKIADDVIQNLEKINHHGKRADAIVKGMLQHSRSSSGQKEPTDINALCDEYLRLSYHGLRAKDKSFNATIKTDFDKSLSADEAGIGKINIIPQDIGRVILNLLTNAFYAVCERSKAESPDHNFGVVDEKKKSGIENYDPTVSINTKKIGDKVEISVSDNGNGIPQKVLDKIFQPFFTTKPTGQGTGLGLSLSYDIVKAHGGELKVETKVADPGTSWGNEGTTFIISLPFA